VTVIFHKIINPTANLFVGVYLCDVNWPLIRNEKLLTPSIRVTRTVAKYITC